MGSIDQDKDVFTVLVTGFGPFKTEYPVNPSWEIARGLPSYLPANKAFPGLPPVRIVVYPEPVRVDYKTVRSLVPRLWDSQGASLSGFDVPRIDLMVHIGMAGPRLQYSLEHFGRRDGYRLRDVDGELLQDSPKDHDDPRWIWYGVPPALPTDIDLDTVLAKWTRLHPDAPLRISQDAGRYLCDFIYFTSLAHLYKAHDRRKAAFLHVPASAAPERVETGRALVVDLIGALVETEIADRKKGAAAAAEEGKASGQQQVAAVEDATSGSDPTGKWYRD